MTILIEGGGDVFEALVEELRVLPTPTEEHASDISFRFRDRLPRQEGLLRVGPYRMKERYVEARQHGYDYSLQVEGGRFQVIIAPHAGNQVEGIKKTYKQTWDWNFLTPAETTAKNIMYNLFDLVTAVKLLEKGASYLHASTAEGPDGGVALIAWGGVGKTTSILKLVRERSHRFLSDDLGLVTSDGELIRTPKKLQIYAYNVAGEPGLKEELIGGRGMRDLVNWHWRLRRFGPKKVRRRVSAEEFLGAERVGRRAPLREAIFLERRDVPEFRWGAIEAATLAKRSAAILVDEINTLFELAIAAESHGIDLGIGTAGELQRRAMEIQEEAFSLEGVQTRVLVIPQDAGPGALLAALEARGEG